MLEADEIGKRGQAVKRNAVNVDGYDSDSSNEGFDGRVERKGKEEGQRRKEKSGAGSKMEEDNDMFADLDEGAGGGGDDDEEVATEGKKSKKQVKFINEEEIQGQVMSSKSGGHVSAELHLHGKKQEDEDDAVSSSDSDADDEERANVGDADEEVGAGGKKQHAPRLDAFNMRNEQEEGRFDEQGMYIRKAADTDAVHDSWLDGVSKKDMRRAKEAADKREDDLRSKRIESDKILTSDLLKTLIPLLERGETALEALARLGRGKKKEKPKWQKGRRKDANEMDVDRVKEAEDPKETRRREAIEAITGAADQLLTRGQAEIYDTEKELLTRQYTRETGEQWADPPQEDAEESGDEAANGKSVQWQYRWSDARDGGQLHGPYESKMMRAWVDAGYFGDGIEYKEVGTGDWTTDANFV